MKETFVNTHNPILPVQYHVPDSEGHVMPDGNLYIYGSFDNRDDRYCSEEYHVVSTPDMEHWTIYDTSLTGSEIPWFNNPDAPKYPGIDWSHPTPFILKMLEKDKAEGKDMKAAFEKESDAPKPPILFAPDCLYRDGKYYLYFCMPDDSEGVAVSDRPEGPFRDPVQLPIGGIDPAVFIDDDGQAYLYWGQLFSHGAKLAEDMTHLVPGSQVDDLVTEEEHFFHEGSSMRRIGDTYYYVYADMQRGKPTSLGYATGKSPLGPFTYRGIIIDNSESDPASWNNHGSITCFGGQWYVVYHRPSRGTEMHRRLCIERITILPDGSIPEVKMTSQGPGAPFGPGEEIEGYRACGVSGGCYVGLSDARLTSEEREKYPEALTNIGDGNSAVFRYVTTDEKPYTGIRVKCHGAGTIRVLLEGKEAGRLTVKDGENEGKISADCGTYELKLVFEKPEDLEILSVTMLAD